jgi:hypothetical protein
MKNGNDSICLICGKDDETVEHFILKRPALSVVRDPVITEISFILYEHYRITFDTFNIQKKIIYSWFSGDYGFLYNMGFQHLGIEDFYIISLFPGVVFSI